MRIGQLDCLIELHRYVPPEGSWKSDATYQFVASFWAARKSLRADERYSPDVKQRYADVALRFTTYWRDDVSILDRLKDEDGKFWDIRSIGEVGYHEFTEIDATLIN